MCERKKEWEVLIISSLYVRKHETLITYMISSDGNPGGKGFATFVCLPFFWARQQLEE